MRSKGNVETNISISAGVNFVVMSFTNTQRSASSPAKSGITNLRVIHPPYVLGDDLNKIFTDIFLAVCHTPLPSPPSAPPSAPPSPPPSPLPHPSWCRRMLLSTTFGTWAGGTRTTGSMILAVLLAVLSSGPLGIFLFLFLSDDVCVRKRRACARLLRVVRACVCVQ